MDPYRPLNEENSGRTSGLCLRSLRLSSSVAASPRSIHVQLKSKKTLYSPYSPRSLCTSSRAARSFHQQAELSSPNPAPPRLRRAAVLGRSNVASSERVASSRAFNLTPSALRPRCATLRSPHRDAPLDSSDSQREPSARIAPEPANGPRHSCRLNVTHPHRLATLTPLGSQPTCPTPSATRSQTDRGIHAAPT